MEYIIRELKESEYPLLTDFLYEAIFQRDEKNLLPKTIISDPTLQVYIQNFGSEKDDHCLCAEIDKKVIGAVWVRNINGFGTIDEETPEFAISLYKEYRGHGIGLEMMRQMLVLLKRKGYKKASLAVQKDNYALQMYQNVGFEVIAELMEVTINKEKL